MDRRSWIPPQIKCNPLLKHIHHEIFVKRSNQIIMVVGLPGVGKTTVAEDIMWAFDRDAFNRPRADLKNFVHTKELFVKAVERHIEEPGRVICWEEPYIAGVENGGANSRQFMSKNNLQISSIFQIMRRNRHLILLTLPFSSAFDFQARSVCHGILYITDRDQHGAIASYYKLEPNPVHNTVYKKRLVYVDREDGIMKRLENLRFGMPPRAWHDACTEKSDFYKKGWMEEIGSTTKDKTDPDKMGRSEIYRRFKLGISLLRKNPKLTPFQLEARTGMRRSIWQTATSV